MDARRGLEMWGPAGRWLFLNWPRGSWQYDLICAAIIVGLFALPNPAPPGAQLELDAVLAAIAAADAETTSFTADLRSTEKIPVFDEEEVETGTVKFLKPNYFRRDISEPGPRVEAIADGKVTLYLPRIRQAQILDIDDAAAEGEESAVAIPGLNTSAELKRAYAISLDAVGEEDGKAVYTIRLVPHLDNALAKHYQAVVMDVVEGEWHPARRIVLEDHGGATNTLEFSNLVRNVKLSPDDFKVTLPPGTEIVSGDPSG